MLKFIRGKGQQPSIERQKLQKELFAYRKTTQHGFPHKPTAIAYDHKKCLMAIGTQSGAIKVFGKPGVEFYGHYTTVSGSSNDCIIQLLEWVPDTGCVLSLTTSNQLVLWEPADSLLVPIKSISFDAKLKKISTLCCSSQKDTLWIGTEGGNVYQFDIQTFKIKEPTIQHDIVFDSVPPSYKSNPGAIEDVKQSPTNPNHILIAYNRGLCVLWDLELNKLQHSYISPGHGQSVGIHFNSNGKNFTWYHDDGSYATWSIDSKTPPTSEEQHYVPYGPDPCKSINRLYKGKRGNDDLVVFSGGMPRSAYGDHQCISVHCEDGSKIALDFTSKVVDFFVTCNEYDEEEGEVLIVLLEEELVAYDLTKKSLPQIKIPYLHSLHASAVTCNHLVSQVSQEVYDKIIQAGQFQNSEFSTKEWPVNGGDIPNDDSEIPTKVEYEILLTGHEDGSVKFWDCTGVVLIPLLHFKTTPLFAGVDIDHDDHIENVDQVDESEPPFRKAGLFDPYSDDPRFAVKKIAFCPKTGVLVVAGTAGHVITATFDIPSNEQPLKVTTMNLVCDRDGFVWKGHDQLKVRTQHQEDGYTTEEGVHVVSVLQVLPPAAITCVALQTDWNVVAAGTAHGLVLFDYSANQPVLHKCTLNPNDLTGAGETLSRRKSFKKTLRESFRRLRRGRSTRNNPAPTTIETRPIERQVEARPVDDGMGSMVRYLTFAKTYLTNAHSQVPTLWSATNSSCVSIFMLNVPQTSDEIPIEQRKPVSGQLAKEIQLKHRAPVVGISIIDNNGVPIDFPDSGASPHKVIIASEEQFKVFSLPQLKPVTKYKLTANEGARVRRMSFAVFSCPAPPEIHHTSPNKSHKQELNTTTLRNESTGDGEQTNIHTEIGLLCLTNLGDCLVLSVPELKRQLNVAAIRREDINGISSLCFTNYGEALYMMSSSEIQRITLSAKKIVSPEGKIHVEGLEDVVEENGCDYDNNNDDENDADTVKIEDEIKKKITENDEKFENLTVKSKLFKENHHLSNQGLTNGFETSPNKANETITSSIGDITIDSVRDHLNTTTTTLCSTTTEEIVGRISVLSTQTSEVKTTANKIDPTVLISKDINDLSRIGDSKESNSNSVVIRSVITSVNHGTAQEPEVVTITRKESKF